MRSFIAIGTAAFALSIGLLPITGAFAEGPTEAVNHSQLATGTDAPTRGSSATVKQKRSMSLPASKTQQRGIATPDHWHQSEAKKQPHLEETEHPYFNKMKQAASDNDG